jgi:hypothetical protein
MRKAKYWGSIFTLFTLIFATGFIAPFQSLAADGSATTSMTRDTGGGAAPIVKAKWEMNGPYNQLSGTDDSTNAGAQFEAPGAWDATMQYSICAIVTDPDGASDIDGVYTDIYYPSDRAFHPEDDSNPDQDGGGDISNPDYGLSGCGAQRGDENRLTRLSKTDGLALFCNTIRNNNNNLPSFFGDYDYDEICAADGELQKETAYVYCADKELIWEDPAGDYLVEILALDKAGVLSDVASNHFRYVPLTSYEVDFNSVSYGNVKLNTHKRISGDKTFSMNDGLPTVRNTGNTRLYMGVMQDDMGLGTTDSVYNVKYDARIGNNEADWKNYYPMVHKWLEDILDLSETEEVDFSILVTKFPNSNTSWTGNMTLDAKFAEFRQCYTPQN